MSKNSNPEIAGNANKTLENQETSTLTGVLGSGEVAPTILDFFANKKNLPEKIYESIITNPKTPDTAIVSFARQTQNGALLELITLNQQRLIRVPAIIEAILGNSSRTTKPTAGRVKLNANFLKKNEAPNKLLMSFGLKGKMQQRNLLKMPNLPKLWMGNPGLLTKMLF